MDIKISAGAAFVLIALVLLVLMCAAGCAPIEGTTTANPVARIQIDPLRGVVKMESSRDDKASLGELTAQIPSGAPGPLAGTTLQVKDLDLDASASKVRRSNVGQLAAMDEFNRGAWEGAAGFLDSAGNIVGTVMPRLYPNTGAEVAKAFSNLLMIVVVCAIVVAAVIAAVLFGMLWRWAFPPKDATQALLVELMRSQRMAK